MSHKSIEWDRQDGKTARRKIHLFAYLHTRACNQLLSVCVWAYVFREQWTNCHQIDCMQKRNDIHRMKVIPSTTGADFGPFEYVCVSITSWVRRFQFIFCIYTYRIISKIWRHWQFNTSQFARSQSHKRILNFVCCDKHVLRFTPQYSYIVCAFVWAYVVRNPFRFVFICWLTVPSSFFGICAMPCDSLHADNLIWWCVIGCYALFFPFAMHTNLVNVTFRREKCVNCFMVCVHRRDIAAFCFLSMSNNTYIYIYIRTNLSVNSLVLRLMCDFGFFFYPRDTLCQDG